MFIKVCGMRSAEQIAQLDGLVEFLGFIYYPGSKRKVTVAPPSNHVKRVGVFVNACVEVIRSTVLRDRLDYVQLHGEESPEFALRIKKFAGVIKAFGVDPDFDFDQLQAYADSVDYFLFDTPCLSHGGSGRAFQWEILENYKGDVPFFLSGGLSPALLPDLLRFQHPRCVGLDLNSRFELSPGQKNIPLLIQFIDDYHAQHAVS